MVFQDEEASDFDARSGSLGLVAFRGLWLNRAPDGAEETQGWNRLETWSCGEDAKARGRRRRARLWRRTRG